MKMGVCHKKNVLQLSVLSLVCILSFLGGSAFLGTRGAWFLALGGVIAAKQFLTKQIRVDFPFIVTVIFSSMLSTFRAIFSSFEFSYFAAYAIVPVTFFLLGRESSFSKKEFLAIAVSLALGHSALVIGNIIYTLRLGDYFSPNFGIVLYFNFWTHNPEPRTFFSIDMTIIAALGVFLLIHPGEGKRIVWRFVGAFFVLIYLISSVAIGVRSPIVVAPFILVTVTIYTICQESSKKRKAIGFSVLGCVVLCLCVFWAFVQSNVFSIRDILMRVPGFNRFISTSWSDDGRARHYIIFAQNWLDYPLGGMYQAGLLGKDSYGNLVFFHNGFLQVYTHGGFPLTVVAIVLLILLARQIVLVKRTPENGACLTLSVSIIAAIFGIFMIEPMINSGPFISSYLFLAGGYLAGQLAKQRNEKPFFSLGLNDWEDSCPSPLKSLIRLVLFILSGVAGGVLVFVTSGSPFYALFSLAAFVLVFLLLDKSQYNAVSWVKTAVSLAFATSIVVLEFRLLPNPSLLFSIAKVLIGFFSFLLVRVIIIQKRDPEDGYRALRNLFVSISRDASLAEENLVN